MVPLAWVALGFTGGCSQTSDSHLRPEACKSGFQCTWRVHDAPLVQRYGFFGFDGKEIKDAEVTCDVCGCDCAEESYLYDDEMDICPRCFKLDAESAQQYEDATHQRWGKPVE